MSRSRIAGSSRVGLKPGARGRVAVPGFVDLQVNGYGGVDFLAAASDDYARAGEAFLLAGVTAYQPTFITSPETTRSSRRCARSPPAEPVRASSGRTSRGHSSRRSGRARTRWRTGATPTSRSSTACSTPAASPR